MGGKVEVVEVAPIKEARIAVAHIDHVLGVHRVRHGGVTIVHSDLMGNCINDDKGVLLHGCSLDGRP